MGGSAVMSWGNYQSGKGKGKGGYNNMNATDAMMMQYMMSQMMAGGKGMSKGYGANGKPFGMKQVMYQITNSGALPGARWENDEKALVVLGLPEDATDLDMYKMFAP